MDEGDIGMRIERVDIATSRALGRVTHVGVLRALKQLGGRRVAAFLDIEQRNGGDLDHRQRHHDADEDRDPAENALLHDARTEAEPSVAAPSR